MSVTRKAENSLGFGQAHVDHHLGAWLFRDVRNSRELQKQLRESEALPEAAFLNASLVPDAWLLQLAAHKALAAAAHGTQRARSFHAELICALSGSRHIGEALKRFGVGEDAKHLLVAKLDASSEDEAAICGLVQGTAAPLSELSSLTDHHLLKKYHKLAQPELGSVLDSIICRIAARDC